MKRNFILLASVAILLIGATFLLYSENGSSQERYLFLSGLPLQYAESSQGSTNIGYLILHPGMRSTFNATLNVVSSQAGSTYNHHILINTNAPMWLKVNISSTILYPGQKVNFAIIPSSDSPLNKVGSIVISANDTSILPASLYFIIVNQTEQVVPQEAVIVGGSKGYNISASFIVASNSVRSIEAKVSLEGINVTLSSLLGQATVTNSTGLFILAKISSPINASPSFPISPSPLVYTFFSTQPISSSYVRNSTYTLQMIFHLTNGNDYLYSQKIVPQQLGNQSSPSQSNSSVARFLIVMSDKGYNESMLHGAPSNLWPVMYVSKGQQVQITVLNNDSIEPHGFAINHYFDRGTALAPGQSYTITFTASDPGRFIIYCNIPCSIHVYMVALLVVQ